MDKRIILFIGLLLVTLLLAGVVYAQEGDQTVTDDDVNRVARELYCPICENTPLDACETQACEDWRQLIREKLEAGQSEQQIVEYFAEIYGERARATPTTRGLSLVVWILPVVGAVAGVIYLATLLRRWLARGASEETDVPSPTIPLEGMAGERSDSDIDEYVNRLEREVNESL
jgi:cytochrome c-type biogenesis protein CcmH